jgi:hypothetical protein
MPRWTEVIEPAEIARLNKELKRRLREGTRAGRNYVIGYPAGSFLADVRFAPVSSAKELWIFSGNHEKTGDYITLVGRHASEHKGPLLIDVQFNFPKGDFSRMKGGAFVKDPVGRVFLAHRGIITRGTARLTKDEVLLEMQDRRINVSASDRSRPLDLLKVVALDDGQLVSKILRFAAEIRDAATLIAGRLPPPETKNSTREAGDATAAKPKSRLDLKLSEYRDEFAASRVIAGRGKTTVTWRHGAVVKALRGALEGHGEILKCQAADLVVKRRRQVDLYEVKRSSGSQSIYTAIGQLVFNGYSLQREFQAHSVRRLLVLPGSQKHQARRDRCKELGFELVTFVPHGAGYRFTGLPITAPKQPAP